MNAIFRGFLYSFIFSLIRVSVWMWSVVENPLQKTTCSRGWLKHGVRDASCDNIREEFVNNWEEAYGSVFLDLFYLLFLCIRMIAAFPLASGFLLLITHLLVSLSVAVSPASIIRSILIPSSLGVFPHIVTLNGLFTSFLWCHVSLVTAFTSDRGCSFELYKSL